MELDNNKEILWIPKLKFEKSQIIINDDTFNNLQPLLDKLSNGETKIYGLTALPKIREKLYQFLIKRGFKVQIYNENTKILVCRYHVYTSNRTFYSFDLDAVCPYSDETCNYDDIEVPAYRTYLAVFLDEKNYKTDLEQFSMLIDEKNKLIIQEDYCYK